MTTLITANGYKTIRTIAPEDGQYLPSLCLEEERQRDDGYIVFAMQDGRMVADSEGWVEEETGPADPQAALMELRYDD